MKRLGQVWPAKHMMGWSEDDPTGPVFPTVDTSALRELYDTDAHFVPYWLEGEPACPRLLTDCPDDWPVRFDVVPLDCEPLGHKPDGPWRIHFRETMDALGWGYYETRGGARALFALEEPVDRKFFLMVQKRAAQLAERHGVRIDPTCIDQWGRCYRLPFVTRDGVPQRMRAARLHPLPVVPLSQLPGLSWGDMFAGIGAAPLPLASTERAGEGGRNTFLTRHAGALRNKGLSGAALLEELGAINETKCSPPLPAREVAAIARSAERWDAGARTEPEVIENDEPLYLGDEVEIARRLLAELPDDTVGDRGALWSYAEEAGVWRARDGEELARRAARFSGFPVYGGKDKKGEQSIKPLRLRNSDCKGIAAIMLREHRSPGFFDVGAPGVAFSNGFFGLSGLEAHSSSHRARCAAPFEYVQGAEPQSFITFLRQIWACQEDADELIALMRQIIGVYAAGLATRFQRAFILLGGGDNGKSVLLDVIRALFPDQGVVTAISPQEWGEEYRRARLAGALVNIVSELPEVEMMSSEKIKGIISGDVTEARAIYGAPFDFQPRAGHLFSANGLPGVRDHSTGFWRRWTVIPFKRLFLDHEKDRGLTGRLIETSRALILSWAVDAVPGVMAAGDYAIPMSCAAETRAWRSRADQIACFLDEDEVVGKAGWKMGARQLYQRYVDWARQNNHRQLSNRVFGERLKTTPGIGHRKTRDGHEYFAVTTE